MKNISLKIKNRFLNDTTVQIAPTGKTTLPNGKITYATINTPTPVLFSMDFKSNKCNRTLMSHLYGLFREPFIGLDEEKAKTLLTWFDILADKNKLGEYASLNKDTIISKRNKATEEELKEFVQNLANYLAEKTGNESIVNFKEQDNPDIDAGKTLQYEFVQITNPEMAVLNGKGMGNCIFGNKPNATPNTYDFASQVSDSKHWLQSDMNYVITDWLSNREYDTEPYECEVLVNPYPFFIIRDKYNSTKEQDHRRYVLVYADKNHWCVWNDEDDKIIEHHIAQNDYNSPDAPKDEDGKIIPSIHISSTNAIVAERCLMRMVTGAAELLDKTGIDIEKQYNDYKNRRANNQVLFEKMTSYGQDRGLTGARNELEPGSAREREMRNQNEQDRQREMINAARLNRYTTTVNYYIVDSFNKPENAALSLRINMDMNYLMKKYLSRNFREFIPSDDIDINNLTTLLPDITQESVDLYQRVRNGDIEGLTDEQMDNVENIERAVRVANTKITVNKDDLNGFAVFLSQLYQFSFGFPRTYLSLINTKLNTLGFRNINHIDELDGEQPASFGIATMFKPKNLLNVVKLSNIPQQELNNCNIGQIENAIPFTSKDDINKIINNFAADGQLNTFWTKDLDEFARIITTVLPPNVKADDDDFAALYKKSKYDAEDVKRIIEWSCGKAFTYNKSRKKNEDREQKEDFVILNELLEKFINLDIVKMLGTSGSKSIKLPKIKDKNQIDYATCNMVRNGVITKENKLPLMEREFGRRFTNSVMDLILTKYSKEVKDFNMIKKLIRKDITEDDLKEGSSFYEFFNNPKLIDDINALHVANVSDPVTTFVMNNKLLKKVYNKYVLNENELKNIIDGTDNADTINAENEEISENNTNEVITLRQEEDKDIKKLREEEAKNFQELLSKYENHPLSKLDPADLSIADVLWINNYLGQKSIVAKLTSVFGENGTAKDVVDKVKEILSQDNGAEELKKWFTDTVKLSKSIAGALTNSFTANVPNEPTEEEVIEEEVEEQEANEENEEPEIIEEDEDEVDEVFSNYNQFVRYGNRIKSIVNVVCNSKHLDLVFDEDEGTRADDNMKIMWFTAYKNLQHPNRENFEFMITIAYNGEVTVEGKENIISTYAKDDFTEEAFGNDLDKIYSNEVDEEVEEPEIIEENEEPINNNYEHYVEIIENYVRDEGEFIKNENKNILLDGENGTEEMINRLFTGIENKLAGIIETNRNVYNNMHENIGDESLISNVIEKILEELRTYQDDENDLNVVDVFGQYKVYDMIDYTYEAVAQTINESTELPNNFDDLHR